MKVLVAQFIMFQNHPTPRVNANNYVIKYLLFPTVVDISALHVRGLSGSAHGRHPGLLFHPQPHFNASGGNSFDAIRQTT